MTTHDIPVPDVETVRPDHDRVAGEWQADPDDTGMSDSAAQASREAGQGRPLCLLDPTAWEGEPVPPRQWIVQDMIPAGTVTLLMGDGAAGKTTLALQLAVARALGRDWIGQIPSAGRTLFLSAEDDADELHRRLDAIRRHYGASFSELGDLRLVDLVGEDAVLGQVHPKTGTIKATALFAALVALIETFRPGLLIIDASADVFGGDENSRAQTRQFIGLLKKLAKRYGVAFLLLGHPSIAGMISGTGSSGSTAWNNSVRSRLYFDAPKADDGAKPDPDLRILTVKKLNYGRQGAVMTVRWTEGAYRPEQGLSSLDELALAARAQHLFLELLRLFNGQGQNVGAVKGSNYAPAMFARHARAEGISQAYFAEAMQVLLDQKSVRIEAAGPPSRRRQRLVIPGE